MRLILTRHGETIENEQGILSGHQPGTLSVKGIEQARLLAIRLKNEPIDRIYSSDLLRATDTLKEIITFHPGTHVLLDRRLRETDYGCLTGKSKKLFDFNTWSPFVESREHMRKRVRELLDEVYTRHPDDSVLFVGHAGINRALISIVLDEPADYMREVRGMTNTAIYIFHIQEGRAVKTQLLNSTDHLVDL